MKSDTNLGQWLKDMELAHPLTIAGPCSAESEEQVIETARQLSISGSRVTVFRAGVWKPRTRPGGFEGIGAKALPWLQRVQQETGLLTAVEVANTEHVELALKYGVDILWLGARTTVNPFAVQEIAESLKGTQKIVWVKNPVNPDLALWIGALERLYQAGITKLGAIHRGFSTYNKSEYRNQPQWQIPIDLKREISSLPIICDPSHICGKRATIQGVAQTALDLKFDGLIVETHPNPDAALSDANQQLTPTDFHNIIRELVVRKDSFEDANYRSKLKIFREEIDILDEKLLHLLNQRMEVATKIGYFKKEKNVAVLQNSRFSEILEKMLQKSSEMMLSQTFVNEVFKAIHQESIRHQEGLMNDK